VINDNETADSDTAIARTEREGAGGALSERAPRGLPPEGFTKCATDTADDFAIQPTLAQKV